MTLETFIALVGGGIGGVFLTIMYNSLQNRMQKMMCHYIEDDILSKIPQHNEDQTIHENLHCKKYEIINTTNKDIADFKIFFQFDSTATIIDCFSTSKEGYNRQSIKKSTQNNNEAVANVRKFNRGDKITYTFRVANITENNYYVTESDCMGFKIKCKDKRNSKGKSKSNQSTQILITKH